MQYILTRESLKFLDGIYNINNLTYQLLYCYDASAKWFLKKINLQDNWSDP